MNAQEILSAIDSEIARLQQVKALLSGGSTSAPNRIGRPIKALASKKRTMSPEGRAKIAAAQKKRWAAQKKAAK